MKKLLGALGVVFLMSASCKPELPIIPDDMLVSVLVNGEWSITDYKLNSTDLTSQFNDWRFKYHQNNTVDAKYVQTVQLSGTWSGSQSSMSFTVNFPSSASPYNLVNGTWQVTQPGTRVVVATQTAGSDTKTMKLYRE